MSESKRESFETLDQFEVALLKETIEKREYEFQKVTQELLSERDALKAELEYQKRRGGIYWDLAAEKENEIFKLKAELEILKRDKAEVLFGLQECIDQRNHHKTKLEDEERYGRVKQEICEELQIKRDLWKSRAAKYREALEKIKAAGDKHGGEIAIAGDIAQEALREEA